MLRKNFLAAESQNKVSITNSVPSHALTCKFVQLFLKYYRRDEKNPYSKIEKVIVCIKE